MITIITHSDKNVAYNSSYYTLVLVLWHSDSIVTKFQHIGIEISYIEAKMFVLLYLDLIFQHKRHFCARA